ncbi:MAG TPA: hypothetical protein PLR88_08445 [Bacteroidales bacterium]|nr:hypothetical protein [Bacteroidales bacterium]HPT21957.1 hypothetical protein [Bacteroidales bacterium]
MKHLFAIVLMGLMVITSSCKYFKNFRLFGHKTNVEEAWKIKQDSIRVADSIMRINLQAIENAKIDSARRAEEERMAWESKNKYNIIVGSFLTPDYAKNLSEVYKQKGYNTKIIKMSGGMFDLVSAEVHENFRQAFKRLKDFQDTGVTDAWIYEIR